MTLPLIGIDIRLVTEERTGDATVALALTRALLQEGREKWRFRLYTHLDAARASELCTLLYCEGREDVELVFLPAGKNRFLWNLWTLPRELRARPVEYYHTQYIAPLWLPQTTKLLTHIHDVSFAAHPEWIGWRDRLFLSLLIPRSLRRSSLILVPSQFTQKEVEQYYPYTQGKVNIVHNAVADEWLEPIPEADLSIVRERYQLPKRYIIASGTMQPRKNIPLLIQAWAERPESLRDVGLVLTGNRFGHHVDPWVSALSLEGVIFTGYLTLTDLRAVMAQATVLAFPSFYEGFGIPLLEAFAVGVPVWASRIPPFEEVGGTAPSFFDPHDLAEAKKTLYSLLVDPGARERLSMLGRERLSLYRWERSARTFLALCE